MEVSTSGGGTALAEYRLGGNFEACDCPYGMARQRMGRHDLPRSGGEQLLHRLAFASVRASGTKSVPEGRDREGGPAARCGNARVPAALLLDFVRFRFAPDQGRSPA